MNKDLGFLGSSTDSTKRSNMVNGLVVIFSGLIIGIARQKLGIELSPANVNDFFQGVVTFGGFVWAAYGIAWKFLIWVKTKFAEYKLNQTV